MNYNLKSKETALTVDRANANEPGDMRLVVMKVVWFSLELAIFGILERAVNVAPCLISTLKVALNSGSSQQGNMARVKF